MYIEKWEKMLGLGKEPPVWNSKKHLGLPKLEWTNHLTECLGLSGIDHPDYREYVKENNARGYCVLIESQETWTLQPH